MIQFYSFIDKNKKKITNTYLMNELIHNNNF